MKPLSPIKYIKANIKKTASTCIAIMLGVFVVYFFSLVTETTNHAMEIMGGNEAEKVSSIFPGNNNPIPDNIISEFKNNSKLKFIAPIAADAGELKYSLGLGNSWNNVYNLYGDDIEGYLSALDLKLISGKLPQEGSNEILVCAFLAKQNGLKINSIIGKKTAFSKLDGDYKVSGIIDGSFVVGIVNNNKNNLKREDAFKYGFFYSSTDGSHKDLSYLLERKDLKLQVNDFQKQKKLMGQMGDAMNGFSYGLGVFIIIILCVTLGNLNYITFKNRIQEFFILHAMGYKNSMLMRKLWKENLLVCTIGYMLGMLLCFLVVSIFNLCILSPEGKPFLLISVNGFICSVTIPIFVSIFSLIPCLTSRYREKINTGI